MLQQELQSNNNRKRIFVDMDGVLCEYHPEATVEDYVTKGYFASLKPRRKTVNAIKNIAQNNDFEVFVLSAVVKECSEQAIREKNEWLNHYLPEIDKEHRVFTLCGSRKTDSVKNISKTDVLLDDYSKNLSDWINAGGKAIKVLNECNGQKGTFSGGPRMKVENESVLLRELSGI